MRKSIYVMCVLLAASLFAGCSNNDEATTDDSNKLPKTKGDYTVKTAKAGAISLTGVKGSIKLDKEGVGDMKLSLKDFEYTGPTPSKSKLSVAFTVTLAKKSDAYAITFAKQDIDSNAPISMPVDVSALSGLNLTALSGITELSGLTALSGVDSITLEDKTKQIAYTTTVDVVKEVDHDGGKVQGVVLTNKDKEVEIKIGAKVTIKTSIKSLTANEFLDFVKDATVKAALKALYNYSGSDPKATAAKTALQNLINGFIAKYKAGVSGDTSTLILTATKYV